MNERIEKIGEQVDLLGECTPTRIPGRYVGYITREQIEKFAELIVKECAQRCEEIGFRWHAIDSARASGAKAGAFECATDLKKHFGVE